MKFSSTEWSVTVTESPRVSVIVPAWNVANYIGDTIESLLAQTYVDFEIIIVDDCSEDNTYDVAFRYSDSRIRIIRHEVNQGPARARNTGIRNAKGEFIALLDADDLAYPKRLELQVAALDADPRLVMIGSHVSLMTDAGVRLRNIWKRPVTAEETAICLIFRNTLSAVYMFRKSMMPEDGYRSLKVSEDYDFNIRMAQRGWINNLNEPLSWVRVRRSGLTGQFSHSMLEFHKQIAKEYLEHLGLCPTDRELEVNTHIGELNLEPSVELLEDVEAWLIKLATANDRLHKYDTTIFWMICGKEWFEVCKFATPLGIHVLKIYNASPLSKYFRPGAKEYLKLIVKSAIRHKRSSDRRSDYL